MSEKEDVDVPGMLSFLAIIVHCNGLELVLYNCRLSRLGHNGIDEERAGNEGWCQFSIIDPTILPLSSVYPLVLGRHP